MNRLLVICLFLLITSFTSKGQIWKWVQPFPKTGSTTTQKIVSDNFDNVIVTGDFEDSIYFGNYKFHDIQHGDMYIAKYNKNGLLIWAKHVTSYSFVDPKDIAVDLPGNVYIIGEYADTTRFGNTTLQYGGAFLAKIDPAGNFAWVKRLNTSGSVHPYGIAVDNANHLVITGTCGGSQVQFDSVTFTYPYPSNYENMFLIKYDPNGNLIWAKSSSSTGTNGNVSGRAVCTGDDRSILVIGDFNRFSNVYFDSLSATGIGTQDVMVVKFDDKGNAKWVRNYGYAGSGGYGYGIATDHAGKCRIGGDFNYRLRFGATLLEAVANDEIFFAELDSNGNLIYAAQGNGNGDRHLTDVVADNTGKFYMTGYFRYNIFGHPTPGDYDVFITEPFFSGAQVAGGPGMDIAEGIAADSYGNCIVLGQYSPGATFGSIQLDNNYGGFIAKLLTHANVITGNIFNDTNGNGIRDTAEMPLSNVRILNLADSLIYFSNQQGNYVVYTDTGNQSVTVLPNKYWEQTYPLIPSANHASFLTYGLTDSLNDFGLKLIPGIQDLRISITAERPALTGSTIRYFLTYENLASVDIASGSITLVYDNNLNYVSSSTNYDTKNNNIITWNYYNLTAGAQRSIITTFNLPSNPSLLGTDLVMIGTVAPFAGDSVPDNNADTLIQQVVASYDPNYKEASPKGIDQAGLIPLETSDITYTVHFENTGNSPAIRVMVVDTIDNNFDLLSLENIASSHAYTYQIGDNNEVYWVFDNIMLAPSKTGFIKFQVKINEANRTEGLVLNNHAWIYFDLNPPIRTNETVNTLTGNVSTGLLRENSVDFKFSVLPNPVHDYLFVSGGDDKNRITEIEIYDVTGVLVYRQQHLDNKLIGLQVSSLNAGIHFIRIHTPEKTVTEKLVLVH